MIQRILVIIFVFLFLILIGESIYLISFPPKKNNSISSPSSNLSTQPTPVLIPYISILYQALNDTEGRTIIYKYQNPTDLKHHGFDGIGFKQNNNNPNDLPYLVGLFKKIEFIANSNDAYLYLYDPLTKKNLEKVRILLKDDPQKATKFGVEILSKEPGAFTYQSTAITQEDLNTKIKPGDSLIVFPYRKSVVNNNKNVYSIVTDSNNIMLIEFLVYRRLQ